MFALPLRSQLSKVLSADETTPTSTSTATTNTEVTTTTGLNCACLRYSNKM